jgi:hypothetical protein
VGGGQSFTFTADPGNAASSNLLIPESAFSQLGNEQNGVYFPSGAALPADPLNPSLKDLVVDGSSTGGVNIQVDVDHGGRDLRVTIDDGAYQHYQGDFPAAEVSHIIVNGGPVAPYQKPNGGDHIRVANDVTQPALLLGSIGNDHIEGGGGSTIILGGLGSDHLQAGSGGAILIPGTTDFDRNLPALDALLTEWARTDESYSQRVANLSDKTVNGVAPNGLGQNDDNFLNAATVHEDGAGNELEGGPGLDWFFANLDGIGNNGVVDKVTGLKPGEIRTGIIM